MKKYLLKIVLISLVGMCLVSCGKSSMYESSMQKAKEAVIERKFEQAEGFVEMALEDKPKEEEAKNYQKQIQAYIAAIEFKEKEDTKNAVTKLDEVINVKNGSEKIVEYAKKEKKELENKKEETKTSETKETTKKDVEDKKADTLWDASKDDSLRTFMTQFSQTMNQSYKEYNQSNNVDLYGVQLPDAVLNGDWKMAVNEQPVQVEWSKTGEGNASYQLVAVYSDAETQPYMEQHVYFFVIENSIPKVFVTQQNQGNDQNYLYFNQSQNEDVNNVFNQIVSNKEVNKTSNSEETRKMSFEEAVDYAVGNSAKWVDLSDDEKENLEIVSVNNTLSELRNDSKGDFYTVVLDTNLTPSGTMQSGKQFKVYLDGSLEQRSMGAGRDEWINIIN